MKPRALGATTAAIALIVATPLAFTQEDPTRQIIPEELLKARPPAATPAGRKPPRYKPAGSNNANKVASGTELGVTLWRLRAARASDDGARLLVQEAAGDLTADRVDTNTPLAIGDRVRLTIEFSNNGYLYVIDRELYADGTKSDPYLIFPTSRTREGDNSVRGGRLIDIPGQRDNPNYFTVKPSRPQQVGELLTIMITPKPLPDVALAPQAAKLPIATVEKWEKAWAAPVEEFTQEGSRAAWTKQEQAAAADGTRLLTQEDPAPQTLFRIAAKKGAPVLVHVKLPYAASDR
jgi:hypothetical protein